MEEKTNIGARLKAERERLGLGQLELAEPAGVTRNTQWAYEKGERAPDATYLACAATLGVDVQFVITGVRAQATGLTQEQAGLLEALERARGVYRDTLLHLAEVLADYEPGSRQPLPPMPAPPQRNWEVRPDIDLALWRSVALSLPGSPNAGSVSLTPQQWLDIVNDVYERAKSDRAAQGVAERGARSALARAQKK